MASLKGFLPKSISLKAPGPYTLVFGSFFGKYEMEMMAEMIVRYLRIRNKWDCAFSYEDIYKIADAQGATRDQGYVACGWQCLVEYDWIKHTGGRRYKVQPEFIQRLKEKIEKQQSKVKA